jgi:long-chain acyl-CoA synthetase
MTDPAVPSSTNVSSITAATALSTKIHAAQTVRGIPPESYLLPFPTIAALLQAREQYHGQQVFLIYYDEEQQREEYTYKEFILLVRRTAALLRSLGIERGGRIATAAHNHPDTIVQYFAAWMIGACVVPLNMSEDDARLRFILEDSAAELVLCRSEYAPRIEPLLPPSVRSMIRVDERSTAERSTAQATYHALLAQQLPLPFPSPQTTDGYGQVIPSEYETNTALSDCENEALIVYTSGTTGNPKGVVLTQRAILADSDAIMTWHGITDDTRMMCVLPVHHVNGTIVTHTTPFLAGASVVLNRKFQSQYFFERIEREGVHIVSVVPTLLAFLLEHHRSPASMLPPTIPQTLRHLICGAGPLTCELARQFESFFQVRVVHGYGLSETTCYSCFLPIDLTAEQHAYWMQHFGFPSIGVPLNVNEMAIHDEYGRELQPEQRGEIVVRGANVMKEYYHNPRANESTFAHGWFRSGDEGFYVLDEQSRPFFFITGRLKELIIRGGVNLAPLEIDEVLAQAPRIKAGMCVGFENDVYGEEVGAVVLLNEVCPPHLTNAEQEAWLAVRYQDILAFCQARLPFAKAPKVVVAVESLPVTSTGKYQRNAVKPLFAQWKSTQFRPV